MARLLRTSSVDEGVEEETGEAEGVAMTVSVRSGEEVGEATDMMVVVDVEVDRTVAVLTIELAFPAFCLLPTAISTSVAEVAVVSMHESMKHTSRSCLMHNIMDKKKEAAWLESLALAGEGKHLERKPRRRAMPPETPWGDDGGLRKSEMGREPDPVRPVQNPPERDKQR